LPLPSIREEGTAEASLDYKYVSEVAQSVRTHNSKASDVINSDSFRWSQAFKGFEKVLIRNRR
jgi:hypothetical protein